MIKKHFQNSPDSSLQIISERDRNLINEFNKTEVPIPDCLIQNFFEVQVDTRPEKIAVVCGDKNLTYKELGTKSNQLAWHLLATNFSPGDIVGICIERSVEMIISILAVLKAGGCYLPLDPSFPEERINYMLENSETKILICENSIINKFIHLPNVSLIIIDDGNWSTGSYNYIKPDLNITPLFFAYMLYTSGSSGKPKGVRIHHQAVVNFINSMIHAPGMNETDKLLAVTTLSFDIAVLEIFLPLSVGATVIIADKREVNNGVALVDLIKKHNITFLQATPSLWNFILATGWDGNMNLRGICGGESLSSNLVRQVFPKVTEFWNFYGPTETTVWSTGIKITDPEAPILIGKPIDNTKIYILDNNLNLLPIGISGEICIGGLGVAKGYFKNTEITSKKFIPYGNGAIIYKTGDFGRFKEDGNIEFLGRIDNQIKLKGYRIEPGEIETEITRLKGVKEAVVKLVKFDDNDDRLVAFINVSREFKLSRKEMIDFLCLSLPQYMIPRFFQYCDNFPRLPNGKIDKESLLLEANISDQKEKEDTIDFSTTEEVIFNIWREALQVKDILKTDNFFEIGGNSLIAISVFSKMTSTFNVKLELNVFFKSPRIIDLAEVIDITLQKSGNNKTDADLKTNSKFIEGEL